MEGYLGSKPLHLPDPLPVSRFPEALNKFGLDRAHAQMLVKKYRACRHMPFHQISATLQSPRPVRLLEMEWVPDEVGLPLLRQCDKLLDPVGCVLIIIVELRDKPTLGEREAMDERNVTGDEIWCFAGTFVLAPRPVFEMDATVGLFSHPLLGVVGASVADHDDLDIAISLVRQAFDGADQ